MFFGLGCASCVIGALRLALQSESTGIALGNAGDVRSVGAGISEMRIDYGPGYRVYYVRRGADFVVLLCGGDKSSQSADITRAMKLASEV